MAPKCGFRAVRRAYSTAWPGSNAGQTSCRPAPSALARRNARHDALAFRRPARARRASRRPEQWLLIEWPKTEKEPTKYWLSNLPASISLRKLVATAKLRWRIERDYEELKQELGLGHFEGRNWRGFHHHATLCIAAYGFLVVERCLFSPAPDSPLLRAADLQLRLPRLPHAAKPRGAAG
jgi:SRSO17 transposase